ncbi:diguanylate cyclase [Pelomonas sp. V22]|uniref:ligand-binding sensor domain-containing diguanylate cyclase n=1 Tax=Pelomonas sp. V22 TaxID=2822139 RepID=UPI0024A929BC|nr:ligand-binding sensor domain-containing diguanylate cyclase [Pelomonas sp. V22]MDI4633661.1 diguanylate cyclase [Pelomonas sp. V22]
MAWAIALGAPQAAPSGPATPHRLSDPTGSLSQYKLDLWQTEQGLPLNTVQALLQTRDGQLWVGTSGGLARFDGARFTGVTAEQAPMLASGPVFGLLEDEQRQLWIGHAQGAVLWRQGRFEQVIAPELTEGRRVWGFAQGPDGAVWMASESGLLRWQAGKVRRYQQADGLPTNKLRALAFDAAGVLWIATSGGGLVSFENGKFLAMNPENGRFPHAQVRSVIADAQGGIWAATAGAGLVHLQQGRIARIYTMADGLPTDHLTALARDGRGALWIGTWGAGLSRMGPDGRFSSLGAAEGLAGNQIWALALDREGSVWVGNWVGGLNRLRNRAFVVFGAAEGLSHDNVRAVLHGRDGVTWVSTAGGGLNRIEGEQLSVLGKKDGLPTEEISALAEDRDGSLWIGTYTAGLAHRLPSGRIETYGTAEGLPGAEIRSLLQDRQGQLWVGTRAGLARFNGKGFEPVNDPVVPAEGVLTMLEDRSGTLWFGTAGQGLLSFKGGRFSLLKKADGLLSNWIMALHEDADGVLWIGTNGEGLNRLRDGKLASIRTTEGLWDSLAQTILEDRAGNLWMSCNRGFYRVARAELNAVADGTQARLSSVGFGPGDALRGTTFAGGLQGAGAVAPDGRLWLPSANGLVIVDPRHLPGGGRPPEVRVDNVQVGGASQPADAEVQLPPGAVPLAIRYTVATLLYADRVRFRYQMEGLSQDWVDMGSLREVAFPALPHGQYRFRVSATTDGVQWSEASPLVISVAARFYQTAWFVIAAIVAGALGLMGLMRLRVRSLQARQHEMELLVAQRTDELREANEHLSRLSYADALTGLANRRRFDEALHEEWRRARRSQQPLALLIADIDCFKAYNDLLGHPEGDRCLKAVAGVFTHAVGRAGDLAARYGGEEFVILVPGADHEAALAVAEGLRLACEALGIAHPASPVGPVVTLSLGVSSCVPGAESSVESLLAQADAALYRAKQAGRNRVC